MRHSRRRVTPVLFGDAERLQHHLRGQPPGRDRDRSRAMRCEVLGMGPSHAGHRHLGEIIEWIDPVVVRVVLGRAVRHLDKQTARTLDQQRQRMMRRDQMRMHAEHAQAVLEIMLPDGLVPFLEILAAPDVIDEDIETTPLGADAVGQLLDLLGDEMIDLNGDAVAAGCGNELGGFLDGFRPSISDCSSRVVRPVT
jgi:hypothetical protein